MAEATGEVNENTPIDFVCGECDEPLRGLPGAIAKCPYCDHLQDAPHHGEDESS